MNVIPPGHKLTIPSRRTPRELDGLLPPYKIAETEIRASLRVPEPTGIAGKSVLVFDDVFTGGLTLNEVARALRGNGAALVCGVSLARQIYRGPSLVLVQQPPHSAAG